MRASSEDAADLLHPNFVEFGASGRTWDRETILSSMRNNPAVSGDAADFCPEELAHDVVLLTYRIVGEQVSLRSSVWVREPGQGWRIRFHQGTRAS